MDTKVKSGNEILQDFFDNILSIENVDKDIAEFLVSLYQKGKLTDTNVKNELQRLRDKDGDKNK